MRTLNPKEFENVKLAQVGDTVEGLYLGVRTMIIGRDEPIAEATIHFLVTPDGRQVRFFGTRNLDPQIAKKSEPGKSIRVTVDKMVKEEVTGAKIKVWSVERV